MIDVSVVIVSYNTRDLLAECLASLPAALAGPNPDDESLECEVILVDNASADGSTEMVRQRFPAVRVIANDSNVGFAAATNQGIDIAGGRHILLLNPDTSAGSESLRKLSEFLDDNRKAGAVGPQLQNPDGSFQHGAFRFPSLLMSFFDFFPINHRLTDSRLNGRYPLSAYGQPFQIDHPLGACLMVRHEAIEQVGKLDERFFIYCEEIDWCMRIKKAGWDAYCLPEAIVVHHGGQSTRLSKGPMFVELHRSRFALYRKHYSPLFRSLARVITRLGLAWESKRVSQRFRRGEVSEGDFKESLDAFKKIEELMKTA